MPHHDGGGGPVCRNRSYEWPGYIAVRNGVVGLSVACPTEPVDVPRWLLAEGVEMFASAGRGKVSLSNFVIIVYAGY